MQIVIVDNNDIRNRLTAGHETTWVEVGDNDSAYMLARRTLDAIDDPSKVVVLLHLKLRNKLYQPSMNAGVEVLEFLRLSRSLDGMENSCRGVHCVVYSAMPLDMVLREQLNLGILHSPGTTYHYLTSDKIELDWDDLAAKRFDP